MKSLLLAVSLAAIVALPVGASQAALFGFGKKPAATAIAPTGATTANEYNTESAAKKHCGSGKPVVWANLNTKVFHFAGNKEYGTTKHGAYMCETDATTAGFHAAKTETPPA